MTKRELKNLDKLPIMLAKIQAINNLAEKLNVLYPKWYLLPVNENTAPAPFKTSIGLIDPAAISTELKSKLHYSDYYKIIDLIKEYSRIVKQKLPA